jgi:lipid II:glycine glycyltransferase (peptidoglycan interpeptide bridge formation enzyme)
MTVDWNTIIAGLPDAPVLQSREWGRVKSEFGWKPYQRTWKSPQGDLTAAAMTLVRRIPLGGFSARLGVAYVPRGPLLDWSDNAARRQVLADLVADARRRGSIFVKIDPQVVLGTGVPGEPNAGEDSLGMAIQEELKAAGWRFSPDQIQYRNTILLDLRPEESALLAAMKQKTRYNIRLAGRKGVTVRRGSELDFDLLFRMYRQTAERDGFVIRQAEYYDILWRTFFQAGMLDPLVAEVEGNPVAGLALFRFGRQAVYMHGMSTGEHREKMPNYLLQWEAIQRAKTAGCLEYDLWGAPDRFEPQDPMWGVFRFKEGLGGRVVRYIGAWDFPLRPLWYRIYTQVIPRILSAMRARSGGFIPP